MESNAVDEKRVGELKRIISLLNCDVLRCATASDLTMEAPRALPRAHFLRRLGPIAELVATACVLAVLLTGCAWPRATDPDDAADTPALRPVMLVPKAAIKNEGTQAFAFVVANGIVERRAVKAGGTDGDRLEVLTGLSVGEKVVVSPPANMAAGMAVNVK